MTTQGFSQKRNFKVSIAVYLKSESVFLKVLIDMINILINYKLAPLAFLTRFIKVIESQCKKEKISFL